VSCSHVFKEKREVTYRHACKLCGANQKDLELAEAQAALDEGQRRYDDLLLRVTPLATLHAERAAHEQTRRAWAADILDREGLDGCDCTALDDYLDMTGDCVSIPATVADLVRAHAQHPVGKCDRCGAMAPLVNDLEAIVGKKALSKFPAAGDVVCAWGCAPKAEP
jgi:hypothetical protein